MLNWMTCVVEGITFVGVGGLLVEFVPGGGWVKDVCAHALKRYREKNAQKKLEDDVKEMIAVKADAMLEARVSKQAVEDGAPQLSPREKELVLQFVTAMPDAARQSQSREDDPTGTSLPLGFTIHEPEEVVELMPKFAPKFVGGDWVPGREDNWRLERHLGGGGFGQVWLARHVFNGEKPRAVKFCTDPKARQKLITHEKVVIERVMHQVGHHPNIVPLRECHLSGNTPWLMYEFVEGGTLAAVITGWQKLTAADRFSRAVLVLRDIASALAHGHAVTPDAVVHRDLKPANVLMAGDVPRVTDYGIGGTAVEYLVAEEKGGTLAAKVAEVPTKLRGAYSLMYSSPQQRAPNNKPDPRDDVHALGVLAYQALIGRVDKEVKGNWAKRLKADGVPDVLLDLIGSSASDEADDRPTDAREWFAVLDDLIPVAELDEVEVAPKPKSVVVPAAPAPAKPQAAPTPAPRKGGDEIEFPISRDLKMPFVWIPPGTAHLGSRLAEQNALAANIGKREDWFKLESEAQRGEFTTKGFWMAKYAVTQAEWYQLMGDTPSYFQAGAGGAGKVKGLDTTRFPVEQVSWDMIRGAGKFKGKGFLDALNAVKGIEAVFGNGAKFALPHEDQWEYACRGGLGNDRAFFWGNELNGTQANIDGNHPFGTTTKGTYLERTCAVDATDDTKGHKYAVHPWGLMHMVGNVWEWCENMYTNSELRVLRAGLWYSYAHFGRAALRYCNAPDYLHWNIGFRLCCA